CPYCDFNSRPVESVGETGDFVTALCAEIDRLPDDFQPETIYVGGGTPTLLAEGEIARLLARLAGRFGDLAGREVTVEANPGTVTPGKLARLREGGVSRLSIGLQSFRDDLLATLGRGHSAGQAREAFELARGAGFDNVNLDVIFSVPGQRPAEFAADLARVAALAPDHLSVYSLIYERDTKFGRRLRDGAITPVSDDDDAAMYEQACEFLPAAGHGRYEVSAFAWPGRECRHNLCYWEYEPYHACGPGAWSFDGRARRLRHKDPGRYARETLAGDDGVAEMERLTPDQMVSEMLLLGLRMTRGVDLVAFERRTGHGFTQRFGPKVDELTRAGLVETVGGRLRLTRRAWPLGDAVTVELMAGAER
ncbi:MAG: radical SAM family heme chaperone HemW, partial [Planctomycetes bacterium]|nr:radical SAM family heme chaperone HemW [Planctomycetota bacterium]